jgi:hypothetical protein
MTYLGNGTVVFVQEIGYSSEGLEHKDCKRFLKMQVFSKIFLKKRNGLYDIRAMALVHCPFPEKGKLFLVLRDEMLYQFTHFFDSIFRKIAFLKLGHHFGKLIIHFHQEMVFEFSNSIYWNIPE